MQVTRLFDPSVINYFDELDSLGSPISHWNITNGKAFVTWSSGDALKPWKANLNTFRYLKPNSKNYTQQITEYLNKDFQLFFITFHQFRPFDFYRLYPKLNN
jgi:trans-aconitate methyltransferase